MAGSLLAPARRAASDASGRAVSEDTASEDAGGDERDPLHRRALSAIHLFEQPLLGALGVLSLVFGFFGYRQYFRATGQPSGFVDTLYADIQLIKLSSKVNTPDVPWMLNLARLLAPAISGYAAFRGLGALYRERLDHFRVQVARGHVVVVGANPTAVAVTRALRRKGRRVVVVDPTLTPERAASLRALGALTVIGDGTRPEVLHQAGAHRAAQVLALTDDDARNIDVALRSHQRVRSGSARGGRGSARTLGAVTRADLCELLRVEALDGGDVAPLDFFNGGELTARVVHRAMGRDRSGDLVVIAPADETSHLLARLARSGHEGTIRLVGADAEAGRRSTEIRVPDLATRLRLEVEPTGPDRLDGVATVVIGGTGTETLARALSIARRLPDHSLVVAVVPDCAHLRPLLDGGSTERRAPIALVDPLSWWTDADLVLGGTVEVVARATHQNYVDTRLAAGTEPGADHAMQPWDRLPDALKESNRSQARHLWTKLAAAGCALAPTADGDERFRFTDAEVEQLAELEHERWVDERLAAGWRPGARDASARTSPYLIPWSRLDEDIRELDRAAVRGLPTFVADIGYQIVRAAHPTNPSPRGPR